MYDIETINNHLTNGAVEEILSTLNIEYRKENGWISVNCLWHENADGNMEYCHCQQSQIE